jgi:hypothetical protein
MVFVKIPGTFLRQHSATMTDARKKAIDWLKKERIESHVDIYKKRDDDMAIGYVIKQYGDEYMWVAYGPPEVHKALYKNGKLKR